MNTAKPQLAGIQGQRLSPNFAPDKRLRIRIDLGPIQTPPNPVESPGRPDPKTIDVKIGSTVFSLKYWKTKWTNKQTRRVYTSYVLAREDGRREKRASFKKLRARAEEIALAMSNGETARLQLTPADQASYLRSRELVARSGKPLEVVAGEYMDAVGLLSGRSSIIEAVRDYLARHPDGVRPRDIPQIVTDFFLKRRMGGKWKRVLKKMLERFAASFTGPFTSVTVNDLDDWLDGLTDKKGRAVSLRTRRNYFEALVSLRSFAVARGYVPKDWNIFDDVSNPEPRKGEVNIYTPRELVALLNFAESYPSGTKLVPFICITAFAGVRHGEMNEEKIEHLDWKSIRFRTGRILIGQDEAKTGSKRAVDMPKNLVAWIKPYARPAGRICSLKNTSSALCLLRKKCVASLRAEAEKVANSNRRRDLLEIADLLSGPKKNALRKSFISYRKALTGDIERVADEAGNSPAVIRENYLHVDDEMKEEAERWFAIMPTRADVLPLFSWGKQA